MKMRRKAGDVLNKLKSKVTPWFAVQPMTGKSPYTGGDGEFITFPSGPWSIYDGVNYAPPLTIPSHLASQPEAVRQLTESYARYHSQFGDPYLIEKSDTRRSGSRSRCPYVRLATYRRVFGKRRVERQACEAAL